MCLSGQEDYDISFKIESVWPVAYINANDIYETKFRQSGSSFIVFIYSHSMNR